MAEKVKNTGVTKQSGFLYFLDKNGHVSKTKMHVAQTGVALLKLLRKLEFNVNPAGYISSIKMVMFPGQKWPVVASK